MFKRVIINFILAFGVLPIINPFIVFGNAIIFGFDFPKDVLKGYSFGYVYQTYWGGFLFSYSILFFFIIFFIYNIVIISKVRKTSKPFPFGVKCIVLILLSFLFFLYNIDYYSIGGILRSSIFIIQAGINLIILSMISVTVQYFLVDLRYEKRILQQKS